MALSELVNLIGAPATWHVDGLTVPVVIVDAREVYGRTEVKVAPVGGSGERWARSANVEVAGLTS